MGPVYRGSSLGLLPAQAEAMQAMHSFGRRAPSEGIEVMLPLFDRAPEAIRAREGANRDVRSRERRD